MHWHGRDHNSQCRNLVNRVEIKYESINRAICEYLVSDKDILSDKRDRLFNKW